MTAPARSVLTFRVGDARLAVPAAAVAEVLRAPRLTRLPLAPDSLAGITSFRGVVAPVVSAARLLGRTEARASSASRVILLDMDGPVGLEVDEVTALSTLQAGSGEAGELFLQDGEAVRVIDLSALLRASFAGLAQAGRANAGAAEVAAAGPGPSRRPETALMMFRLRRQNYALPLEAVVEAVALPAEVRALPGSTAADLGVVPYRGRLLPLVDLGALLGLGRADGPAAPKVLVTRVGRSLIGLAVDELDAIVRLPDDAVGPVPAVLNRGGGEARIAAMGRLADGRGLVAILSPDRLFSDESIAHILSDGCNDGADVTTDDTGSGGERFLIFRLGAEAYGLPTGVVDEVVRLPGTITRLPRAPAFVEGVMNLRGQVVPLIDQSRRFGAEPRAAGSRRVIVVRLDGNKVGFIVDHVTGIVELRPDRLRPLPDLSREHRPTFDRVGEMDGDGRLALLVDPRSLLHRAEADLLAGMTAEIAQGS